MSTYEQQRNTQESDSTVSETSNDRPSLTTTHNSQSCETERSVSSCLVDQKTNLSSPTRKATGPRTPTGKKRSSHNSVKHGIFSKAVLLPDESRSDYDSILIGLREYFQPDGTLEEVLVDKLATYILRTKRVLVAEAAEIEMRGSFVEWDDADRQEKEAGTVFQFSEFDGLLLRRDNPMVMERCLELLTQLKDNIEKLGFDLQHDRKILQTLYGNLTQEHPAGSLIDSYNFWADVTVFSNQEENKANNYPSAEECKTIFLRELEMKMKNLNRYKKERASIESERMKLEALRRNVPDTPQLDRLLRYEVTLERGFERTLIQLERHQRMRRGEAVSPPINVNLSH